jgi:hypothetical protein
MLGVLVKQSMCQSARMHFRCCFLKIYSAIDLLALNFCQSFAHKMEEKNGRHLTLLLDAADTKGSRGEVCGLWSCQKPDGSYSASHANLDFKRNTKTESRRIQVGEQNGAAARTSKANRTEIGMGV